LDEPIQSDDIPDQKEHKNTAVAALGGIQISLRLRPQQLPGLLFIALFFRRAQSTTNLDECDRDSDGANEGLPPAESVEGNIARLAGTHRDPEGDHWDDHLTHAAHDETPSHADLGGQRQLQGRDGATGSSLLVDSDSALERRRLFGFGCLDIHMNILVDGLRALIATEAVTETALAISNALVAVCAGLSVAYRSIRSYPFWNSSKSTPPL